MLTAAFEQQQVARTAAEAFANAAPEAVPALVAVLSHKLPAVRATAADALGHIGPDASDATPNLIRLLKDTDRDVRYHAVRALHEFGSNAKPAIPALAEVMLDSRELEATRQWSIKTLIVTLPETHDAVVKALRGNKFNTVLGNIGFDKVGDVTAPGYVWYVWEDGTYDYAK